MYQGKHTGSSGNSYNPDWVKSEKPRRSAAPSRRTNPGKKLLMTILALALLVTMGVSGTVAWLSSSSSVSNQMTPGSVPITINETFDGTTKGPVSVTNTGNVPAYIRVAIVGNQLDDDGNVIASGGGFEDLVVSTKWDKLDGYYYYKGVVDPNTTTDYLFGNRSITLSSESGKFQLDILAESIQALGVINGQPASQVAWGVVYSDGTWTKTA